MDQTTTGAPGPGSNLLAQVLVGVIAGVIVAHLTK